MAEMPDHLAIPVQEFDAHSMTRQAGLLNDWS
jgi:hypothetical protein